MVHLALRLAIHFLDYYLYHLVMGDAQVTTIALAALTGQRCAHHVGQRGLTRYGLPDGLVRRTYVILAVIALTAGVGLLRRSAPTACRTDMAGIVAATGTG